MAMEKVQFTSTDGHKLVGRLELPAGDINHYALFAHCFTCTKNLAAARHITRAMTDHGLAVLRFDFTGLGESDGDFADTNFTSNVEDLVAAADFLASEYKAPRLLVGHSLGGAAVLHAARQLPNIAAVATIGAPARPAHVKHLLHSKLDEIKQTGSAEVVLAGRPFRIKRQFLEDLTRTDSLDRLADLKKALLVCHAPLDNTVGIDNAADIFQAAKHPKSFLSLAGADHLLSEQHHARYAGNMIATWADHYLDDAS